MAADIGNYDGSVHQPGYVSEFRFLAAGAQTEDMEQRVEETHARWISTLYLHNIYTISIIYLHNIYARRLTGLTSAMAENRYLEKVKWLDMYGVDLHPVIVSSRVIAGK